jgi:hypothetical protein
MESRPASASVLAFMEFPAFMAKVPPVKVEFSRGEIGDGA